MAIVRNLEWQIESAWLAALRASTDLVTLVGGSSTQIARAYDQSVGLQYPCVRLMCPGAKPRRDRLDVYSECPVEIIACTAMDTDTTGETVHKLAGAIRDVFEASGLLAALETVGKIKCQAAEQPEYPVFSASEDKCRWEYRITYITHATMDPTTVGP